MPSEKGIQIIFGGAVGPLRSKTDTSHTDVPQVLKILRRHGVTRIDTAAAYGDSEEVLGLYKAGLPEGEGGYGFVIDTKNPGGLKPGSMTKQGVISVGKESLKRLDVDQVDVFYFHCPPEPEIHISESLAGMNELHKLGMFKRFGLSNFTSSQIVEVYNICKEQGYPLPSVYQGNYNAFARGIESTSPGPDSSPSDGNGKTEGEEAGQQDTRPLLPLLRSLGMSFHAYSPAAGGFLSKTKESLTEPNRVTDSSGRFAGAGSASIYNSLYNKPTLLDGLSDWNDIATSNGMKPLEMALRWVRHNSFLDDKYDDALIVGGRTCEQMEETLGFLTASSAGGPQKGGPLSEQVSNGIERIWDTIKNEAPMDNYHDYVKKNLMNKDKKN